MKMFGVRSYSKGADFVSSKDGHWVRLTVITYSWHWLIYNFSSKCRTPNYLQVFDKMPRRKTWASLECSGNWKGINKKVTLNRQIKYILSQYYPESYAICWTGSLVYYNLDEKIDFFDI
jgi:hypothetical protein